jgi:DNA-binding CsgD family transcriptional regulator
LPEDAHSTVSAPWWQYDERRILRHMQAVRTRDVSALLEIVHDGAIDSSEEAFPSGVLRAVSRLIPSDAFAGYEEADFDPNFRVIEEVEVVGAPFTVAPLLHAISAYDFQNPMSSCVRAREERVVRLSDLLTRRQRRSLEFDALVWKPHGIDDALRMWLPAEGSRVRSIFLERSGKNYTDREVTLFSLLRPHFIRMRAAAESRRWMSGRRGLSARESEVLGWIARGKTNAEIGDLLFISPHTVRKHIENIFEKLDVRTRTAAAAWAHAAPLPES